MTNSDRVEKIVDQALMLGIALCVTLAFISIITMLNRIDYNVCVTQKTGALDIITDTDVERIDYQCRVTSGYEPEE